MVSINHVVFHIANNTDTIGGCLHRSIERGVHVCVYVKTHHAVASHANIDEISINQSAKYKFGKELDGHAVSALRGAIQEVKQRWLVIGWVTKNLSSRVPPCIRRHVKPLVPAVFAVATTRSSFKEC
jgi:hypothetical protein